ncbi:vacuolar protein sorting-associated protein 45, partial [Moniliophthora roreri]
MVERFEPRLGIRQWRRRMVRFERENAGMNEGQAYLSQCPCCMERYSVFAAMGDGVREHQ